MLATLGGSLALLLGLALLLLPLLVPELSRARDSVWGALVLLLGLALVTSAERLAGSPMLVVLSGGLLLGRLGIEVAQGRWLQLSAEERQALRAAERWQRSLAQLVATARQLLAAGEALLSALPQRSAPRVSGKRWIRQESAEPAEVSGDAGAAPEPEPVAEVQEAAVEAVAEDGADGSVTVTSFAAIDALLEAAPEDTPASVDPSQAGSGAG